MTDKQIINQEEAIKMIKKLNEKLKNVDDYIVELRSNFYRMKQDLDRKEQECEELKEINQELLKYRKHSTTCQECYEDGLEDGKTSNKELRKLRKTLAEIKEIINEFAKEDILTFPDFSKEKNYELIQKQCGEPILKILQKINEVEDETNKST